MNWHTCVSQLLNILWLMRHKTPPGQNSHHENAMYWTEEDGFIEPDDKQSCYWKNSPALLFCISIVGKQGFIQLTLFPPDTACSKGERGKLVFLCLAPSSLLLFSSASPNIAWPSPALPQPHQCPQAVSTLSPTGALENLLQKIENLSESLPVLEVTVDLLFLPSVQLDPWKSFCKKRK